jgi:mono/diheme cytochrome c family protein
MGAQKVACLVVLALTLVFPPALAGQGAEAPTRSGTPQTDAQLRGDALFDKNCFLCHEPTRQTRELKIAAPDLIGLLKQSMVSEEAVRRRVQEGIPRRMPSFRYTLTPGDVDDLIAYLKIR